MKNELILNLAITCVFFQYCAMFNSFGVDIVPIVLNYLILGIVTCFGSETLKQTLIGNEKLTFLEIVYCSFLSGILFNFIRFIFSALPLVWNIYFASHSKAVESFYQFRTKTFFTASTEQVIIWENVFNYLISMIALFALTVICLFKIVEKLEHVKNAESSQYNSEQEDVSVEDEIVDSAEENDTATLFPEQKIEIPNTFLHEKKTV